MKTSLVILASVLVLGIALMSFTGVTGVAPGETNVTAQVTINAYKDVSLTTCASPLDFGSLNPQDSQKPITCQDGSGYAVRVTNNIASNGNINATVKGTDFSGAGSMSISQVKDNGINSFGNGTVMSNSYAAVPNLALITPGNSGNIFYWINVPNAQTAGAYSSTFGVKTT